MFRRESLLYWSDCVYTTLLSLYPSRFRRHYRSEMAQIFRDCCRSAAESGSLARLWLQTIADISLSAPFEWRRELERTDSQVDYTGLADAFMIAIVVGTNLIGWGYFGAAAILHLTLPGIMEYWNTAASVLLSIVALPMAGLIGTLFAMVAARWGRADVPHIHV